MNLLCVCLNTVVRLISFPIILGFKINYILFTFVNSYSMVSIQHSSLFCGRGEMNVQKSVGYLWYSGLNSYIFL